MTAFAAGYEAFGEGCPSDHRVLWADFTYQEALGHEPPPLIEPPSRRLKADDPRLVKTYIGKVKTMLKETSMLKQLLTLEAKAKLTGWKQEHEAEYNKIHRAQKKTRRDIEKNVRKLRKGECE